jgi:hypothetical protein
MSALPAAPPSRDSVAQAASSPAIISNPCTAAMTTVGELLLNDFLLLIICRRPR